MTFFYGASTPTPTKQMFLKGAVIDDFEITTYRRVFNRCAMGISPWVSTHFYDARLLYALSGRACKEETFQTPLLDSKHFTYLFEP
jgi:hypothetical protein